MSVDILGKILMYHFINRVCYANTVIDPKYDDTDVEKPLLFCDFCRNACRIKQINPNYLIGHVMKDPNSVTCVPYR